MKKGRGRPVGGIVSKTGTLTIRFEDDERKLLEFVSFIHQHNCSSLIKKIVKEWIMSNKNFIEEAIKIQEELKKLADKINIDNLPK